MLFQDNGKTLDDIIINQATDSTLSILKDKFNAEQRV